MAYRVMSSGKWELCHDTYLILCVLRRRPIYEVTIDLPISCRCVILWTIIL